MNEKVVIKINNQYQYWTPERTKKIKVYIDNTLYYLDCGKELTFEASLGQEVSIIIKKWFQTFEIKVSAKEDIQIQATSDPWAGILLLSVSNNIQIIRNRWQELGNFLIIGGPVFIGLIFAFLISLRVFG